MMSAEPLRFCRFTSSDRRVALDQWLRLLDPLGKRVLDDGAVCVVRPGLTI